MYYCVNVLLRECKYVVLRGPAGRPKSDPKNHLGGLSERLWALLGGLWSLKWRSLGVFGESWAILERFRSILARILPFLDRFWSILAQICSIWVRIWSLSGSIFVLFRCSFAQVGRVVRRRAKPHFDSLWASRNEVRRLRARAKNRWKIVPVIPLAQITQQLS